MALVYVATMPPPTHHLSPFSNTTRSTPVCVQAYRCKASGESVVIRDPRYAGKLSTCEDGIDTLYANFQYECSHASPPPSRFAHTLCPSPVPPPTGRVSSLLVIGHALAHAPLALMAPLGPTCGRATTKSTLASPTLALALSSWVCKRCVSASVPSSLMAPTVTLYTAHRATLWASTLATEPSG